VQFGEPKIRILMGAKIITALLPRPDGTNELSR